MAYRALLRVPAVICSEVRLAVFPPPIGSVSGSVVLAVGVVWLLYAAP